MEEDEKDNRKKNQKKESLAQKGKKQSIGSIAARKVKDSKLVKNNQKAVKKTKEKTKKLMDKAKDKRKYSSRSARLWEDLKDLKD